VPATLAELLQWCYAIASLAGFVLARLSVGHSFSVWLHARAVPRTAAWTSVGDEERKKLLAAAAARRNKDAAPQVPCLAEAQRFAVEQAAQQQADVLDTTCCTMSDKEQWAA
jgi:hypothetical protein